MKLVSPPGTESTQDNLLPFHPGSRLKLPANRGRPDSTHAIPRGDRKSLPSHKKEARDQGHGQLEL